MELQLTLDRIWMQFNLWHVPFTNTKQSNNSKGRENNSIWSMCTNQKHAQTWKFSSVYIYIYIYIYEHKYWKIRNKIKAQKQQKTSVYM